MYLGPVRGSDHLRTRTWPFQTETTVWSKVRHNQWTEPIVQFRVLQNPLKNRTEPNLTIPRNTGILSLLSSLNQPFRKLRSWVYIHGSRIWIDNPIPRTFFSPFVTFCRVTWTTWPIPVRNSGFEPHIIADLRVDLGDFSGQTYGGASGGLHSNVMHDSSCITSFTVTTPVTSDYEHCGLCVCRLGPIMIQDSGYFVQHAYDA